MMIKYKFTGNISKLENWIENYGKEGYVLTRVSGGGCRFEFLQTAPDGFVPKVRIDYHSFRKSTDFQNYVTLFEDSGWRHLYGTYYTGYQIFQQNSPDVTDEIFSDQASKAERYKRVASYWLSLFCVYLPLLVVFQNNDVMNIHSLFHLKDMYYTPGLWERTGSSFWFGFLFETPFAMGRAFGAWLFVILTLGFLVTAIRALYWYHKEKTK